VRKADWLSAGPAGAEMDENLSHYIDDNIKQFARQVPKAG